MFYESSKYIFQFTARYFLTFLLAVKVFDGVSPTNCMYEFPECKLMYLIFSFQFGSNHNDLFLCVKLERLIWFKQHRMNSVESFYSNNYIQLQSTLCMVSSFLTELFTNEFNRKFIFWSKQRCIGCLYEIMIILEYFLDCCLKMNVCGPSSCLCVCEVHVIEPNAKRHI